MARRALKSERPSIEAPLIVLIMFGVVLLLGRILLAGLSFSRLLDPSLHVLCSSSVLICGHYVARYTSFHF